MKNILIIGLLVLVIALSILLVGFVQPPYPRCLEDQSLVGVGDFENGTWSAYVCGAAVDDYLPFP